MRQFVRYRIVSFSRPFQSKRRWALNFDGVGVRSVLAQRVINPDGDIDIEFYSPPALGVRQVIISQQINLLGASEFYLESDTASRLVMVVGASPVVLLTVEQGYEAGKKYRFRLVGTALTVWKNAVSDTDTPLRTATFTRGATREPTAITVIGAAVNTTAGTYTRYFAGVQRDIKINGVRWPMADYNQSIQLPQPSGLGAELLVNPSVASDGASWGKNNITVQSLSSNSFRLTNTQANYAGAIFQTIPTTIGNKYVIRFKVGFQTGGTNFRVSINSTAAAQYTGDLLAANYTVSDQYLFVVFTATTTSATVRLLCNSSGEGSYVDVLDLTVKPLGTCNPLTISNATSTNWMQIVDDYVAKFRKVLNFDGVGARGILFKRAVEPDGDIDIEFQTGPVVPVAGGTEYTVLSQCLTATFANKEFNLYFNSAVGALQMQVGGAYSASSASVALSPNTTYRALLQGTNLNFFKNGQSLLSTSFTRGAAREPTAQTVIGANTHGAPSTFRASARGIFYNIKINGILWPISDANQSVQLPEPSGLGAELLNSSSFLEPNGYSNTIVTVGLNSFRVLAPTSGATRAAKGFTLPDAFDTVVLEFDFVFKDPDALLSVFIRDGSTVGAGTVTWSTNINVLGKQRFIIKNSSITLKNILFAVNVPCTFEIRNISIKPLGTCNPITLANVTSANWEDLEI